MAYIYSLTDVFSAVVFAIEINNLLAVNRGRAEATQVYRHTAPYSYMPTGAQTANSAHVHKWTDSQVHICTQA